jgi:hypothetical protein
MIKTFESLSKGRQKRQLAQTALSSLKGLWGLLGVETERLKRWAIIRGEDVRRVSADFRAGSLISIPTTFRRPHTLLRPRIQAAKRLPG